MPAPDLPMRERIAEALFLTRFKPEGHERMRRSWREYRPAGRLELWPHIYVEADAVLDLWADLPDTAAEAVEVVARALFLRERAGRRPVFRGDSPLEWEGLTATSIALYTGRARAAFATFKEGL